MIASKSPIILALDTATACSSVAIVAGTRVNGVVLASVCLTGKVSHSRRLLSAIDWLMQEVEMDWPDIDGIAVSIGPGSFTGLRIGMATAKGIAAATGKPLVGVSTLDALAAKCVTSRLICAVLDARKKEVYAALYRLNKQGLTECVRDAIVLVPQELSALIAEPVFMVGDGVLTYRDVFLAMFGDQVAFAPAGLHEPSATSLGFLAAERLARKELLGLADGVPMYVRSSDAELNLLRKKSENER